jgi:hypothetical protein
MARCRLGAQRWAELIDEWRRSGLSLPEFCRRHGLRRGTMQNWVYKPAFRRVAEDARRASRVRSDAPAAAAEPPAPAPAFLPARLAGITAPPPGPTDHSAIEVVLGERRRVAVGPGFDPETLRRVVATLEA